MIELLVAFLLVFSNTGFCQYENSSKNIEEVLDKIRPSNYQENINAVDPNERFDGWHNNLNNPAFGSTGQGFARTAFAEFDARATFISSTTPNPYFLSKLFLSGNGTSITSRNRSVLFAYFGEHLSDDLMDSRRVQCPNQYFNIEIPNNLTDTMDQDISERIIPILRNKYLSNTGTASNPPRTLVNEATAWLDGSVIYGNSFSWSETLRSFVDGKLKGDQQDADFPERNINELPLINPIVNRTEPLEKRNPADLFSFGNPRGNENPFLMSIGILWFRYHNYLAEQFKSKNPSWSDEQLFNEARKWTIATYQKIAVYDWLPVLTGRHLTKYSGYKQHLDPSISTEFAVAAMRVGHTFIPSGVVLRNTDCTAIDPLPTEYEMSAGEPALRLCNTYWQLQNALIDQGIDPIVYGMVLQRAEKDDNIVVEDLSEYTYGTLKRSRIDLETLTIVRGREVGLASFNSARLAHNLRPIPNFSELNPDLSNEIVNNLKTVYGDINNLELYVGGMLEASGDTTGELFSAIIMEQFGRTRDSDRYWFENLENELFTETEVEQIKGITMAEVISNVTKIRLSRLQENVFTIEGVLCENLSNSTIQFKKECTPNMGYNFFANQWGNLAGILVLLLFFPIGSYLVMRILAWQRQKKSAESKKLLAQKTARKKSSRRKTDKQSHGNDVFTAQEIENEETEKRVVIVMQNKEIQVLTVSGQTLRRVNVSQFEKCNLFVSNNKRKDLLVIQIPKEYDIVLRFTSSEERQKALQQIKEFMSEIPLHVETLTMDENALMAEAITKEARQKLLEVFFRRIFQTVLELDVSLDENKRAKTMEILSLELNQVELAEALGMKSNSLFVKQIFQLADADNSGYLSFTEFADLIILLMKGTPEQKAKLLFDMYDVDNTGLIDRNEARAMIRSFLETANVKMTSDEVDACVETIFRETGIENKSEITLEDFQYVMLKDHRESFEKARLTLPGLSRSIRKRVEEAQQAITSQHKRHHTHISTSESSEDENRENTLRRRGQQIDQDDQNTDRNDEVYSDPTSITEEKTFLMRWWKSFKRYVENYRRHILCLIIFYTVTIALIVERALYYAYGSENLGIRRVTEWGIIISRSTAAGMSFHYSFILLTMSRNLITFCRETFLKNYIPFDSAVAFHKQIAMVAIIEALLHTFGHLANFIHISIHPLPVVACLFPTIVVDDGSDLPPTISSWLFATITGLTGVLLLLTLAIMYIFAMQFSRRYCFRAFWLTHHLYSLLYVLIILHGSMGLVQAPRYHLYLFVPLGIFALDKLITISRSKVKIAVVRAEPLPSHVLNLVFQRPTAFDYRSGQWVRIACIPLGSGEYHPFTLTSAPHERHLSLHIRAAGPWTTNLRHTYQSALESTGKLPLLYLDGPFGEGHQDWYKYEVSVLVGAGIGVTPFASIIKDIVHRSRATKSFEITCKKVYFIWVTRTQKQFEWLTDIIRDLEETKGGELVSTHIYITQFSNRFDLRTTLLYICERYFQRVANKSMFTGLKATTHFGRPPFEQFFDSLQTKHNTVRTIGVFSCGPQGVTNGVEEACRALNKLNKARFNHFYENF